MQEGSDNEEVQTIEIEDEDVPLGTLQMTNGTETSMLPKTGEGSRLPYYSVGMLLMFTGVWVWAWGSRRKRGLTH